MNDIVLYEPVAQVSLKWILLVILSVPAMNLLDNFLIGVVTVSIAVVTSFVLYPMAVKRYVFSILLNSEGIHFVSQVSSAMNITIPWEEVGVISHSEYILFLGWGIGIGASGNRYTHSKDLRFCHRMMQYPRIIHPSYYREEFDTMLSTIRDFHRKFGLGVVS